MSRRRDAKEAREAILEAAEAAFDAGGPADVKLKPIAQAAGVTHSGLLYHFGSRSGLLKALFQRVTARLRDEVITEVAGGIPEDTEARGALLARVYERVSSGTQPELLAYLLAHGEDPFPDVVERGMSNIVRGLGAALGPSPARQEDVRFFVELVTLVMYGDLLVGPLLRARLGDASEVHEAGEAFRARFVDELMRATGARLEE